MTKYILNSGGLNNHPDKIARFNREIVRGLGQSPRILLCYFATPRELWEEKFLTQSDKFQKSMDRGVNPKFELAIPDQFEEQIKNSDVVIIHGGDDNLLLSYLKNYNLPTIWQDKVVVGSSAGSDALVKYFWTCDWRQVKEGLGILPIKFIPHYKSRYGEDDPRGPIDWTKAYKKLEAYGDKSLPIHALEEGDFIILEVI
jgi:peptidase E